MHAVNTDDTRSVVCVLVTRRYTVQIWRNRSRCRLGMDSCGPKESRIRWGRDPHGQGQFWGMHNPL